MAPMLTVTPICPALEAIGWARTAAQSGHLDSLRAVDEMLRAADRCLYDSKRNGRDRVTAAGVDAASASVG